ncbi:hypothetical protein WME79_06995 [Sorangium sp. So ce726]|uniref:hypothetical protein n=1 Tax=Sorangium sp. So ce726 TaxID=3133319 RepID=UPI003F647528
MMPSDSSSRAARAALSASALAAALVCCQGEALAQPAAAPLPGEPASVEKGPGRAPGLRGGAPLFHLGARDNALRTSRFGWTTSATTNAFGPDDGPYSDDGEYVGMTFSLVPRYSFVSTREHWAWVGTDIALNLPLSDGDVPGEDSVTLADLPLQAAYSYTIVQNDKGLALLAGPRLRVALPTSPASRATGVYARTLLGLGVLANLPLLDGEWLNGVFFSAGGGWEHLFSQATTSVNGAPVRPRLSASGEVQLDDQLSGQLLLRDQLSVRMSFWVNLWGDLSLGNTWGLAARFRDVPRDGECVQIVLTCAPVESRGSSATVNTTFGVSLSYPAEDIAWFKLGYDNTVPSLGEDGQRRSVFYSPDAELYLSMTLFLDSLYARATTPSAKQLIAAR